MHIKIARNITLDKHSLYLGNSCCLSICSVTDTHTADGYIHLRIEFQCIANGHNKSDRLERPLLKKKCWHNLITQTILSALIRHVNWFTRWAYLVRVMNLYCKGRSGWCTCLQQTPLKVHDFIKILDADIVVSTYILLQILKTVKTRKKLSTVQYIK